MSYDEGLAQRIRDEMDYLPNLVEKKMFGGVGFMVNGNMEVFLTANSSNFPF